MNNIIGRVQKLGKHKITIPDITNNLPTVLVSISFYHNTNYRKVYVKLNSPSTKNMLSNITAAVH